MNKHLPLSSIIISNRARIDYGDIPDLARKIMSTKGLKFNDIVVEERVEEDKTSYHLLAGGRRCKAHELILTGSEEVWGETIALDDPLLDTYRTVPCRILTNVTPEERIRIEFLENMGRKDFTWPEAAPLVTAFHKMQQEKYGAGTVGPGKTGWSIKDTGQELGLNPADVVYYIKLCEGMQTDPQLKDIRQKSKAITKLKRSNRNAIADLLDVTEYALNHIHIKCGDSRKVLVELEEGVRFDMVITDPPWGIGFEESLSQDRKDSLTTNYDTGYDVMDTLEVLQLCFERMKDNTPIYMFYSSFPEKIAEGIKLMNSAGFQTEKIPLIWYKKHILAHDARETRHDLNYESILYGWKGERPFLNTPSRNIFEHQVAYANRIHSGEKPIALLSELIGLHTQEGDLICDPFGGSCIIADACKGMKRKCLVVELDEGLVKMASLRIRGI